MKSNFGRMKSKFGRICSFLAGYSEIPTERFRICSGEGIGSWLVALVLLVPLVESL